MQKGRPMNYLNALISWNPFLEKEIPGVGRVFADIEYDRKHLVNFPNNFPYTDLLINYAHRMNDQTGPWVTINILRGKYWVLNVRNWVRRIIYKLVTHKIKSKLFRGNLPAQFVNKTSSFR